MELQRSESVGGPVVQERCKNVLMALAPVPLDAKMFWANEAGRKVEAKWFKNFMDLLRIGSL